MTLESAVIFPSRAVDLDPRLEMEEPPDKVDVWVAVVAASPEGLDFLNL